MVSWNMRLTISWKVHYDYILQDQCINIVNSRNQTLLQATLSGKRMVYNNHSCFWYVTGGLFYKLYYQWTYGQHALLDLQVYHALERMI